MAVKFSAFTTRTGTLDASTKIVGYDDPAGTKTNVEFSLATLVANSGIYAADGTIGTTRKALITDTIQFRNAGDTSDILKLNTDGTFALGLGASSNVPSSVAIGEGATANGTFNISIGTGTASGGNSIAIGRSSNSGADAIAMGNSANAGANGISMGQSSAAVGNGVAIGFDAEAASGGIAIGQSADNNDAYSQCIGGIASTNAQYQTIIGYDADGLAGADRSIAIGASAKAAAQGGIAIGVGANAQDHCIVLGRNVGVSGTPDNSIVFATRGGNNITYSEADSFTWYNTSDTVPDLKFKPGSDSWWNSSSNFGIGTTTPTETLEVGGNCKITGQGYTEFYDTANTTLTVDWNNSNIQELTGLTGSHTFTASNPKAGATYILTLAQTGAVTATWTGVKWPGGTAPTLSGTGKTDVVTLICYDATGAGLYYGSATLDLA